MARKKKTFQVPQAKPDNVEGPYSSIYRNGTRKDVIWVVDTSLLKGTLSEELPNVIKRMGYKIITFSGNPLKYDLTQIPGIGFMDEGSGPIVVYGSHQFAIAANQYPWYPGLYPDNADLYEFDTAYYMSRYSQEKLFNNNYLLTSINELVRNRAFYYEALKTDKVFVKDNMAFKRFPATVLSQDELETFVKFSIEPDHLVFVSPVKPIFSEHRFIIVNKKIVAHSTYRYDGKLDIRSDVPQQAIKFVKSCIKEWNPESKCYTLDVAMVGNDIKTAKPKLLELNSFSCAGLYACDLEQVVLQVSNQAYDDYLAINF